MILYLDSVEIHRRKTPDGVRTALYPLVNLALGPKWPADRTPDTPYTHVDYVKVWKYVNVPAH